MATVAAVARGAGARAAAAGLRGGGGAAARGRPRAGCARRLCTAPAAVDMKRYLWARYHEAKRSTDGECVRAPACTARSGTLGPRTLPLLRGSRGDGVQNLATLVSLSFPCPESCFIPGDCSARSGPRKCSGPPREFQGRQLEDVIPNTVRCCHSTWEW